MPRMSAAAMLKMLSGDQGKNIDLKAGEYKRLEFSFDMSTTFMEDINDLEVAMWLQNDNTQEIYNSHYAYEYTDHCYPARNLNVVAKTAKWDAPEKGNPVGYNIYLDGKLAAEKISALEYSVTSNNKYLEVVAVYENDKTSIGLVKEITAEENINDILTDNISVYPNPVQDRLYIEAETEVEEVVVYDIYGKHQVAKTPSHQGNLVVDLSDLKAGIYFVKINTEKGNIVKRIIKD